MVKNLILTTTHQIPKKEIKENLGVIFGTTVRTRGMLGRFMAGIEALTGGASASYVSELDKARNEALEQLKKRANEIDADAVVGIDLDISEILEGFIMVTATGTAVKL